MTAVPTIYFAPQTCARVTLTALEEIGEPFETRLVAFMAGEHRAPAYLAINPAGKVPALETAHGVIVQNGAILTYLAQRHPAAALLPIGDGPQALQALSDLFRISADLHPLVTRFVLPQMIATQADQAPPIRDKAREILTAQLAPLEQRLAGQAWMLGKDWSIIDAYLAWIWFRVTDAGFDPQAYPAIDSHYAEASSRPSALAALRREAAAQEELRARGLFFQPPPTQLKQEDRVMNEVPTRRIVTGHNAQGQAIIQADGPVPRLQRIGGETGPLFHEVWNTLATPAPIDAASGEASEDGIKLAPPKGGTRIRVLDIPPDSEELEEMTPEKARAHFEEIGAGDAASFSGEGSRHAHMHRTETIDYGIVLDGEIVLIMDVGETTVRAGDIVIQRGTNHGWANRTDRNCRIAFILIDGEFDETLKR